MFFPERKSKLKKTLTFWQTVMLGVGAVLGPSMFLLIGEVAGIVGPGAIFAFIACSILALVVSLFYIELGLSLPITGGGYTFVNEAFTGTRPFITGWMIFFGNASFAALCALGFGYITGFPLIGGIAALALVSYMNFRGVDISGTAQMILGSVLLLGLATVVGSTLYIGSVQVQNLFPLFPRGLSALAFGTAFIFIAFTGYEDVVTFSEEMKNPAKLLKVMLTVVLIISVVYAAVFLTSVSTVPYQQLAASRTPLQEVAAVSMGSFGRIFVLFLGLLASFGALNVVYSAAARNMYALARDKHIPSVFGKVHEVHKTPKHALLFSFAVIAFLIMTGTLKFLAYLGDFTYFFGVLFVILAFIRLRKTRPDLKRRFKVPFFPVFPQVTMLVIIGIMALLDIRAIGIGFAWLFLGFIVYLFKAVGQKRLRIAAGGCLLLVAILMVIIAVFTLRPFLSTSKILLRLPVYTLFLAFLPVGIYLTFKK